MPPIPHRMVSQNGILSRWPGATSLPSSPMMVPPIRTTMIVPRVPMTTFLPRSHTPPTGSILPRGTKLAAEADGSGERCRDVNVGDLLRGDDDASSLGVGQGQHPAAGDRLGDQLLDVLGVDVGVDGELAGGVLHADLDLHGGPPVFVVGWLSGARRCGGSRGCRARPGRRPGWPPPRGSSDRRRR